MMCPTGRHVLQDDRSYLRACLTCKHVLLEYIFKGWHILQDDLSYRKTRFTGGYVLLGNYVLHKVCLIGGHVFQECMYYERTCITERHYLR